MRLQGKKFSTAELLLKVNNVGFDTIVCQTEIQTEDDKRRYNDLGYTFVFTEAEFKKILPDVDTNKIFYTQSLGQSAIYFNKETLAVCLCYIEFATLPNEERTWYIKKTQDAIKTVEKKVKQKDFRSCLLAMPAAMSMEYFNLLLDKYPGGGKDIPSLFHTFIQQYLRVSYGFDRLKPEVFKKIVESRTKEDREEVASALFDYPDNIRVYRGGSTTISRPVNKATSWTTSIAEALFFAGRLGSSSGYIAVGTVPKNKVIYCRLDNEEKEIIVEPGNVHVEEMQNLLSVVDVTPYLQAVTPMYHKYLDWLEDLEFERESDAHGRMHSARVLLMALTIAEMKGLLVSDKQVLAEAAIYHDSQRDNDGEDIRHGYYSADYYKSNVYDVDPLVAFIIEYHCRPDTNGYQVIQNSKELSRQIDRSRQLFDIFKDADALDRVRFGWQALDINQLRTPEAKSLPLVAYASVKLLKF